MILLLDYFLVILFQDYANIVQGHSIEGIHMKSRAEQWIDWHSSNYYKEVYWLDWQESECGRAWEETMFGGQIAPINNRIDGSHGIAISDYPPRGTQNDPERRVWNTISMRYIEKLFQMSTWQRSYNLQNWRTFNVPRDGATSHYINSFTTMSANEESRVAREDLAEAVALANAQPAKKKRVKATGRMEEQRPKEEKVIEEAVVEQEQQPEGVNQPVPTFDDKRRASSPGALPAQRLILAAHSRRPSLGLVSVPEQPPSSQPVQPPTAAQPPLTSEQTSPLTEPAEIYPKHGESSTDNNNNNVPKEPTSETIKKLKTRPMKGLLAAYRQRRKHGLAKREAEMKKKERRGLSADRESLELLRRSLIRETAAANDGVKKSVEEEMAEAERGSAFVSK